jgi:hypothetical protein
MNRIAEFTALSFFSVLAVLPEAASGSIPAPDGTYTACFQKKSASLKLIDAAKQLCSPGTEVQVTWNQTGRSGTTGPQGPQGYGAAVSAPDPTTGCYKIIIVDQVGMPVAGQVAVCN